MTVTVQPPRSAHPDPSWCAAVEAARELALAAHRLTRRFPSGDGGSLAAAFRRAAIGVALGLEAWDGSPQAIAAALAALWTTGDLVDRAERHGLLDLAEAVELLALGSRVEIPLVACLRRRAGDPETLVSATARHDLGASEAVAERS